MVAHRALKVKAKPGVFCPVVPLKMNIEYIGRVYDPTGDPKSLEAEFKPCGEVEIPSTALYRRYVTDGDLIACDAETASQCRAKFVKTADVFKAEIK